MTLSKGLLLKIGGGVVAGAGGIASTVFGTSGGSKTNSVPLTHASHAQGDEAPSAEEGERGEREGQSMERAQDSVPNSEQVQQASVSGSSGEGEPGSVSGGQSDVDSDDRRNTHNKTPGVEEVPEVKDSHGASGESAETSDKNVEDHGDSSTQPNDSQKESGVSTGEEIQQSSGPVSNEGTSDATNLGGNNKQQVSTDSVVDPSTESTPSVDPGVSRESDSDTTDITSGSGNQTSIKQPTQEPTEVDKVNKKLEEVGMPNDCKFPDENTRTIECSLGDSDKFEAVNFLDDDNGNSEDIDGDISEFKVKIWWLKEDQITSYGTKKEQDLVFTFLGIKEGGIKIGSGEDLEFIKDTNPDFVITDGEGESKKLKVLWGAAYDLTPKVSLKTKSGNKYSLQEEQIFKFSKDGGKTIQEITPSSVPTEEFKSESEIEGFNQGFKFKLEKDLEITEGNKLEAGDYEIKYDLDKSTWYLSSKTPSNSTVEPTTPSLPAPTSSTNLDSSKITELNKKLEPLKLPSGCKFSESEKKSWFDCNIATIEELKNIRFEDKEENEEPDGKVDNMKLRVQLLQDSKKRNYENLKEDLLFTFYGFGGLIELTDGLNLFKDTNPEFEISEDENLKLLWDSETKIGKKVGFSDCSSVCTLNNGDSISFSDDNGETIKKLTPNDISSLGIECTDETENFNQGFKFRFLKQVSDGTNTLERGEYEARYKDTDNGEWYLIRKGDLENRARR